MVGQTGDSPWRANCGQIIAVIAIAKTWDSPSGWMICLQRSARGWEVHKEWTAVTLGRAGLGLGVVLQPSSLKGPDKREGNKKAPAGMFLLEFAFETKDFAMAAC